MIKTVYVDAKFRPIYEDKVVEVDTGEVEAGGFFKAPKKITRKETQKELKGQSKSRIDGERLSEDINAAIEELNQDGFEVVTVSMVTSGMYDWAYELKGQVSAGYGYGYGYSFTEGAIIVAKKTKA